MSAAEELPAAGAVTAADPRISVVVTTCAEPERLIRCIDGILACGYERVEVIAVENRPAGSPTPEALAARFGAEPRVRYVAEPVPGLSRARNAGVAHAGGEVIVFTDDDIVPDAGWLHAIAGEFRADPSIGCVTGDIKPLSLQTRTRQLFEQLAGFGKGAERRRFALADNAGDPLFPFAPGTFGSGANTALRADVARRLGGFDATLGAGTRARGGEDLDCFIRVLLGGETLVYAPDAVIFHDHPAELDGLRRRAFDYGVGLSAMLTKQLLMGPSRRRLLRALPAGMRYALDPRSRKNVSRQRGYPLVLSLLETLGMLMGPFAYLTSLADRRGGAAATVAAPAPALAPAPFVKADVGAIDLDLLEDDLRAAPCGEGETYGSLLALVRLHGDPLGTVEIPYVDGVITAAAARAAAWAALGDELARHAEAHGCLPLPVTSASLEAIPPAERCAGALPRRADWPMVTIIVPTAGRPERMDTCIASLLELDYPRFDILMVDNAPADGRTREAVARWSARDARVRYVAEPLPGSSIARNRGIREASTEILAFTDDDVQVDADWLSWMIEPFLDDARVGVVCGLVMPARMDTPEQRWFEEFSGFGKGFDRRAFDTDEHRADDRMLYPYWGGVFGSGNSMAFRRSVLLDIEGFDPALGAGSPAKAGADIESFTHAIVRGNRLVYEPRALCWHDHRAHDAAMRKQTFNYGVGFTAILTKWLLRDPRVAGKIVHAVAGQAAGALKPAARGAGDARPHELERLGKQLRMSRSRGTLALQLRGYVLGPVFYARSLLWARRLGLRKVIRGG